MRNRSFEKKKVCPRCGIKLPESCEVCSDCGLVFSRLNIATNKEAKNLQKRGEKDFIVYTSKLPSDVSYVKLLCLTIFTGLFGGHCFYVGRYLRASILLLNFLLDVFLVVFNSQIIAFSQTLVGALSTLSGFIMFAWFWDIFMVAFKKFKVPVAIDLQNEDFIIKDEKE